MVGRIRLNHSICCSAYEVGLGTELTTNTSVGQGLMRGHTELAHTGVSSGSILGRFLWVHPRLDPRTHISDHGENSRFCGVTMECMRKNLASLIAEACAVDGVPMCTWGT